MKKAIAIVCGVLGIILYYVHRFTFKLFGEITIEQILWHVFHSTEGTDPKMLAKGYRYAFWALFFSILWCLLVIFYKRISKNLLLLYNDPIYFFKKLKIALFKVLHKMGLFYTFICKHILWVILCVSIILLWQSFHNLNVHFQLGDYIYNRFFVPDCKFIEENSYFPKIEDIRFENGKRNLVVISGESFEETFNDLDVEGAPLLKECALLAKEGQSMPNMYSPSDCRWTISAFTAWHFGLPLKTPFKIDGNEYVSKKGFLPNATSIFDILKENGYENMELVIGSYASFSGKGILFKHGNFHIFDRSFWEKNGYDLNEYVGTGWGYNDNFALERAIEEYRKLIKSNKPFVLVVENVDTHYPNGYCPQDEKHFGDIRDAFIHADKIMASFIREIRKDTNTVVALIGDHLIMGDKNYKWIPESKRKNRKNRRLFNAFWGDIPPFQIDKKRVVSPYDIAPTLLEAAGAKWETRRYGLGVSFFSSEPSLIESIGIDEMYKEISKYSKFYNSLY